MNTKFLFFAAAIAALFSSCKKEVDTPVEIPTSYTTGTYVLNEGSFLSANASITHINDASVVTTHLFQNQNDQQLGDVATDMEIVGTQLFVVLNNSQKVEVLDRSTFKKSSTLNGLDYPRRVVGLGNGQVAVSNGSFAGQVFVYNNDLAEVATVDVGQGPEDMVVSSNLLFVANNGGWALDSTITVIDTYDFSVLNTFEVGHRPIEMETDAQGRVWVLCSGETFFDADWNVIGHSMAKLVVIDGNGVIDSMDIGNEGDHPSSLAVSPSGNDIYFVNNGLYKVDASSALTASNLVVDGAFRSVDCDPQTGDLWLTSFPDYVNNDEVFLYTPGGLMMDSFEVGIAPIEVINQ